ncbi:hypothetical protein SDC9_200498 [bioreactor metagenome]|uniref:Uncharacterized protein n=1 Tax=bioreactor metagenome TaxID=1076179 RepID=A0A645INB1_9ZZZZ
MGTKEKLIERFLTLPKDFTYEEVKRLFGILGYVEKTKGGTSGSRVEFVSTDGLSSYAMKQMLSFIREQRLIEKYVNNKSRKRRR